jgi:hypothetical protein
MTKAPEVKATLTTADLTEKNDLCLKPSYLRKLRARLKRVLKPQKKRTAKHSD